VGVKCTWRTFADTYRFKTPLNELHHEVFTQSSQNLELLQVANMGLLILAKCDGVYYGRLLQFQY